MIVGSISTVVFICFDERKLPPSRASGAPAHIHTLFTAEYIAPHGLLLAQFLYSQGYRSACFTPRSKVLSVTVSHSHNVDKTIKWRQSADYKQRFTGDRCCVIINKRIFVRAMHQTACPDVRVRCRLIKVLLLFQVDL